MTTYAEQLRILDLGREIMNFPSLEGANTTAPLWFTVSANATLTEVGATAAVSDETYGTRCLKVVTTATAAYAAQRLTYADQPRVKSGRKGFIQVAVWSVSSVPARIRLQSSAGSLGVSADTTVAGWTILTIPQVTFNGTYTELRCEVDNGTAYFIPLTPMPRGLRHHHCETENQLVNLASHADDGTTFNDIDCTSVTSNLAAMIDLRVYVNEITDRWTVWMRRNGSSEAQVLGNLISVVTSDLDEVTMCLSMLLDDSQIFELCVDRTSGSGTLDAGSITRRAYWEWE